MLGAAALLLATPSCKKGENDPLSLSSRKSRMAGEYNISSRMMTSTYTDADGNVTEETSTLEGTTITKTTVTTPSGSTTSETTTTTSTLNLGDVMITKDGDYTWTWNTTSVSMDDFSAFGYTTTITSTTTSTMTETGKWNFLGKIDEYKNKERVVFNTTNIESTTKTDTESVTVEDSSGDQTDSSQDEGPLYTYSDSYGNGEISMVYAIDQLKGSEIILKMEASGDSSVSVSDDGVTTMSTSTDMNSLEITLSEK